MEVIKIAIFFPKKTYLVFFSVICKNRRLACIKSQSLLAVLQLKPSHSVRGMWFLLMTFKEENGTFI